MYVPPHFRLTDGEEIKGLIRSNSFATIIAPAGGAPVAVHLPTDLLVREGNENGSAFDFVIRGHMARSNPVWQAAANAPEVLAIYLGAHSYVSPTWYEKPSVPTWNYSAVHLYGSFRIVEGRNELYALLRRLVSRFEGDGSFDLASLPPDQIDTMMKNIVGFEILPTRVDAVAKLSQNLGSTDRESVITHLASRSDDASRAVAADMVRTRAKHSSEKE